MAEEGPDPEAPEAPQAGRRFQWIQIAYAVTAGWMLLVLAVTNADPGHPFFEYIFRVPLAAWIGGAVIAWIVRVQGRR
ncbi:MAG: hypothetical protein QGI63_12755 [Rhodospirillales bacterium]|jgi:hypothetical protein|nr:hypothetical protein [Rhodospirillales bacterium]MDP6775123.1 hypothetical protein [Rhodospirillales bacterium]